MDSRALDPVCVREARKQAGRASSEANQGLGWKTGLLGVRKTANITVKCLSAAVEASAKGITAPAWLVGKAMNERKRAPSLRSRESDFGSCKRR